MISDSRSETCSTKFALQFAPLPTGVTSTTVAVIDHVLRVCVLKQSLKKAPIKKFDSLPSPTRIDRKQKRDHLAAPHYHITKTPFFTTLPHDSMIPATDHHLEDPNSRILMDRLLITQPATKALEEALIVGESSTAGFDDTVTGSLPFSQTLLKNFNKSSFNMDELTQATKPIVESLATFPIMEWSFDIASSVEIDNTDDFSENAEPSNTVFTKSIVGAPHD